MPVATRSFIEAGSSLARGSIALPKDRFAAVALPLKTVYDLPAIDKGISLQYRGFGNIGTESPVKPSSATIAALYELFLVNNRIAQWSQFGVLAANVRKIYSSILYAMLTGQLARPITALSAAHLTIAE
jgi:hypothetical protein